MLPMKPQRGKKEDDLAAERRQGCSDNTPLWFHGDLAEIGAFERRRYDGYTEGP